MPHLSHSSKASLMLFIYAFLVLLGGIIGFIKVKSGMSLMMGLLFGTLLMVSAFAIYKRKVVGIWISLALVLILDAFFTYRFMKTLRFLPSGLFSLLSLVTLFLMIFELRRDSIEAGSHSHHKH
jgi:uncharacterized membrane protein (UPF0136 family)